MTHPKLRFLGIVAHPHDFTHFGGTLGVHTSLGDSATVVAMTVGVGTHNERLSTELMKPEAEQDPAIINQPEEERAAEKADEMRKACALFGVTDVRILKYPDKPFILERNPEAAEELRDIILDVRPHVIISQSPYLKGPHGHKSGVPNDHTETAYATELAKSTASLPRIGSGQAPHSVAATLYPGVYFSSDEWDFVVDISDWFEQRVQAEATYVSQGHTMEWSRKRIGVTVGNAGWSAGTLYAEAFVRQRTELLDRITLPKSLLKKETETALEHMAALSGGG
jgi:LmbE family N-acetylglucosaminyl deacetylase